MGRFHRHVGCLAAVALAVSLAGCGGDDEKTVTETETETVLQKPLTTATDTASEIDLAQSTLAAIVDRDRKGTSYHVDGIRTDPAIAPAFVSGVDVATQVAKADGATGLDFDPILCAQNLPRSVSYRPGTPHGGVLGVVGVFDYGVGKRVKVHYSMVRLDGTWKLNGTDCLEQAVGGEE